MLTFEVPIVRLRMGKQVGFSEHRPDPPPGKVPPLARTLALAHALVRAVDSGECRDFTVAAGRMQVSQARVSMVVSLTFLAPWFQEDLIQGKGPRLNYHQWLRVARQENWQAQRELVEALRGEKGEWGGKSQDRNLEAESRPKASAEGGNSGEAGISSTQIQAQRGRCRKPEMRHSA